MDQLKSNEGKSSKSRILTLPFKLMSSLFPKNQICEFILYIKYLKTGP